MNRRNPDSLILRATLLLAGMLMVMVTAAIAPALPAIQAHFAETEGVALLVPMILTIPALLIAASAPIAGVVVDRIGRKAVLVSATLIFGLAGVAGTFASSLPLLLLTRAGLGIAVGAVMTTVSTLIADYYDGAKRARFLSLQAAVVGLGGTAFLLVGGVLADVSWRAPFLTHAVAFAILPLVVLEVYEPTVEEQCIEMPHVVSEPGQCVAESMRLASDADPADAANTRLSPGLLLFGYLSIVGSQIVFYFLPVQLPFFLQDVAGKSASQSGLALSVLTILYAAASLLYGRVSSRLDHIQLFAVSLALVGLGYLMIWSAAGWVLIVPGLSLVGAGLGLLTPNLNVWLADETPARHRGRVMGGLTTSLFLGRFLSPLVGQPVSASVGAGGLFLRAGVVLLVIAPLFWMMRRKIASLTGRPESETEPERLETDAREAGVLAHPLDAEVAAQGHGRGEKA